MAGFADLIDQGRWDRVATGLDERAAQVDQHAAEIAVAQVEIPTKLTSSPTPSGVVRSLDTVFRPSATDPCLVLYTIELAVQAPLLSSQSITVSLLHDQSSPPSTEDGEVFLRGEQLAGLGLVSIATTTRQQLVAWIPVGDYVKLASAGAGTAALVAATELVFA